jgi:hypothetical protein
MEAGRSLKNWILFLILQVRIIHQDFHQMADISFTANRFGLIQTR